MKTHVFDSICCHPFTANLEIDLFSLVRSYPVAFGLKVQRILPKLIAGTATRPQLPSMPDKGWDAPLMFQTMQFNQHGWGEAKLLQCCYYLRGSTRLNIPQKWQRAFPTHFPGEE